MLWGLRYPFLLVFVLGVFGVTFLAWLIWSQTELPPGEPPLLQTTYICSSEVPVGKCTHETSIAQLSGGVDRETVTYEQVPQVLIDAIVAAEDKTFFEHKGVDPAGVARAVWANVRDEGLQQGGSTITQQYVKNTYLTQERTIDRKVKEAVIAIKLERELPKKEIMQRYLNTIYFGRGAYGVAAASRIYFGKEIQQIGLPEAAYLAGIIRAPEDNDANRPATDPLAPKQREAATQRRRQVLDRMLEEGYVTKEEHDRVDNMGWDYVLVRQQAKNFGEVKHSDLGSEYFIEYVRQRLSKDCSGFDDAMVFGGGLRVYTTIDWGLQQAAYDAIRGRLNLPDDPTASLVAIDPDGNVRALVGGYDWNTSQVNLATGLEGGGSGRQPGSAFKPFALAAALSQGMTLDRTYQAPGTMQLKIPGNPKPWKVSNYGDAGLGTLNLVEATKKSSNTAYAQLAIDVGPENIVKMAKAMGITSELPPYPSVVLGTGSVSVLDMSSAYSTFARGGEQVGPFVITKVTDAHNNTLCESSPKPKQVLQADVARSTNWVLNQVVEGGTGTKAKFEQPAAGKTGTTENYRDAWFAGFTCHLTAAVWVGYPGPETRYMTNVHGIQVAGGTFPTQIWHDFMVRANEGKERCPPFAPPSYVPVQAPVVEDTAAYGTVPPSTPKGTTAPSISTSSTSSTLSVPQSSSTSSTLSIPVSTSSSLPASVPVPGGGDGAVGDGSLIDLVDRRREQALGRRSGTGNLRPTEGDLR
ncbi:MAG: PBP1A family penicillin-binding protein [Acidimicrobiales bacterium]|nr:PBP1A family penicillin-binding protein [Acidimicrobiales bacterium]